MDNRRSLAETRRIADELTNTDPDALRPMRGVLALLAIGVGAFLGGWGLLVLWLIAFGG